jgi:hypothetical protein
MKRYAGKHQKEPGHLTRDTTSPVDYVRSPEASCMVTPGLIMYPVMEDQFPSLPRDATARLRV